MNIEVRDRNNNHLGQLQMALVTGQKGPERWQWGQTMLERIDTPDGFYYILQARYSVLNQCPDFTPCAGACGCCGCNPCICGGQEPC